MKPATAAHVLHRLAALCLALLLVAVPAAAAPCGADACADAAPVAAGEACPMSAALGDRAPCAGDEVMQCCIVPADPEPAPADVSRATAPELTAVAADSPAPGAGPLAASPAAGVAAASTTPSRVPLFILHAALLN